MTKYAGRHDKFKSYRDEDSSSEILKRTAHLSKCRHCSRWSTVFASIVHLQWSPKPHKRIGQKSHPSPRGSLPQLIRLLHQGPRLRPPSLRKNCRSLFLVAILGHRKYKRPHHPCIGKLSKEKPQTFNTETDIKFQQMPLKGSKALPYFLLLPGHCQSEWTDVPRMLDNSWSSAKGSIADQLEVLLEAEQSLREELHSGPVTVRVSGRTGNG